jgi:hypothetical protein
MNETILENEGVDAVDGMEEENDILEPKRRKKNNSGIEILAACMLEMEYPSARRKGEQSKRGLGFMLVIIRYCKDWRSRDELVTRKA